MARALHPISLVLAVQLSLAGCSAPLDATPDEANSAKAETADAKAVESESANSTRTEDAAGEAKTTDSSTDFDLIELVLVDLIDFNEFSPMFFSNGKRSQIILNEKTQGLNGLISDDQLNSESGNKSDQVIPSEICADLRERNPEEPISLSEFKPTDPKILIEDVSEIHWGIDDISFAKKHPNAKGCVYAWLPGYSRDRKTAVVRLLFAPTPHGATATYMLVKQDGRWTIKWRRTAHYV